VTHANTTDQTGAAAAGGRWLHPVADTEPGYEFTDDDAAAAAAWDAPYAAEAEAGPTSTVRRLSRGSVAAPADAGQAEQVTAELDALAAVEREQVAKARLWLPPIDGDVFGCYLGQLAERLDPHTEADPVGVMATLLATAGVHLGPGPHLKIGYERHPLLVWPLLIGATGSGKKGTAYNAAKALLLRADNEFVAANVHSGLSTGEGLAEVFATDATTGDGKPGRARLLPEGDIRLLAFEPEWASVMARMKREGNSLSATLRAAWEGGNLSTLNVDARVARHSHIGLIGHITPKEFTAKVSASDMAGGTYNRFLPIAVAQSKFLADPGMVGADMMDELGASLAARLRHAGRFGAIGFTEAGALAWRRLYVEFGSHTGDGDGALVEFISRAAPNCLRIAAIYAALDRTDRITPAHLTAAAALVRYSIESARAVLHGNTDAELVAWIAQAGGEGRTKTDITKTAFGGNARRSNRNVDQVLTALVDAGRLSVTKRPPAGGRGKPVTVYTAT
jgi:Protein of unknown function (DUF3987)